MTPSNSFVGRQRELDALTNALDSTIAGQGHLVMLVGEPGIGKSRTAQELASVAQTRNALVPRGRCYEGEGAPPYWPWLQILRAYIRDSDADTLHLQMGAGAADIAEILPELREKLPDLKPPPALDSPEASRFRLFDSISSFLRTASQNQPLVLIIEDLQWADQSTLLLLEFIAREIPDSNMLVVGTYRNVEVTRGHPLSETLGRLVRQESFERISLTGLSQEETSELIEAGAGISPSDDVAEAIFSRTQGNPLFVGQFAQMIHQDSSKAEEWTGEMPEAVRDAITERLSHLSAECSQMLTVASVIGTEFDFKLLSSISETSDDTLLELIEEALDARIIEDVKGESESYQFSHPLIQETLYKELSTSRRVRLHARIGEILEKLHKDHLALHSAEMAYHFGKSEAFVGRQKQLTYSFLAGERAIAAYAWDEALKHFERALAIKDAHTMDGEKAALLFALGRAQAALLTIEDARQNLTAAYEFYASIGDILKAVEIADFPLGPGVAIIACWCGDIEAGEQTLRPLREIGPPVMDTVAAVPYETIQVLLESLGYTPGLLHYWKSSFVRELSDDLIDVLVEFFALCPSPMTTIAFEHLGGAISKVGEQDTAFGHRGAQHSFLIFSVWEAPCETEKNIEWSRNLYSAVQPFLEIVCT